MEHYLDKYQREAHATAQFPCVLVGQTEVNFAYPVLKLVGECGELTDKLVEFVANECNECVPAIQQEILKELGDIMWYVAELHTLGGKHLSANEGEKLHSAVNQTIGNDTELLVLALELCSNAAMISEAAGKCIRNDGGIPTDKFRTTFEFGLTSIISRVAVVARLFNATLQDVCEMNIKKLADRVHRNVICSEGDNR